MIRSVILIELVFYFIFIGTSCNSSTSSAQEKSQSTPTLIHLNDGPPDWIIQGNIYEVNIRQYTPEGTFKAFEKNLDRLKEMGVQTLWFMPINPISRVDRKGALGSYYAVADYKQVNPDYGNFDDWKRLVSHAHDLGFKVILDWVPNHTGADHPWLKDHPDFYEKDSATGKALSPFDWTDVRQLNFANREMWDSMTSAMKFWITQSDIDGFRCDHVEQFQEDFWKYSIAELKKLKDVLMLAEGESSWVYDSGFDIDYGWNLFHTTVDIASGRKNALSIDSVLGRLDSTYPENALQLYFTSNHDENSWNKADYKTMPGLSHNPFAVLTQTIKRSVPLIYSGQEEPFLDSISFFYKDTIVFGKFGRAGFYKTLLNLRSSNAALASNASFRKINAGNVRSIYSFVREGSDKKILVILNFSPKKQDIKITDTTLYGTPLNLFKGIKDRLTGKPWKIQPWGYVVYVY